MSKKLKSQTDLSQSVQSIQPVKNSSSISTKLLWKHLTQDDINKLNLMKPINLDEMELHFSKMLSLNNYSINLKEGIFLDFFFTQYWWASEQMKFTNEQLSIYYSIIHKLFENLKEKRMKLDENLLEFQCIMSELCEKPSMFRDDQIKQIITNLCETFFQQYKMYEYILSENQEEIEIKKEISIELPKPVNMPYPPPLAEALTEEMHRKFVLKIPDEVPVDEEAEKAEAESAERAIATLDSNTELVDELQKRFEGISIEDAKRIILEVTNELLADLKSDMRTKIVERETQLINEISKGQSKNKKN